VLALSGKLDDGNEAFPPSNLEFTSIDVGNPTTNVIPAKATARFNVRFNDQWTVEALCVAIAEKCAEVANETGCGVAFYTAGKSARSFLSPTGDAVQLLRQVIHKHTGIETDLSTAGGTSDARFIAQYCPVVEFGLPGQTMHKVDERVAVADVTGLAGLYAAFISAYLTP
jgi:succinyl-diaminopimelate desuccinylase